ncbi:MAG: calcium-binding protein [Pseudomonadota bacterium]
MTKTLLLSTLALAGVLSLSAPLMAEARGGPDRPSFSELDSDSNGEVTQAEFASFRAAKFAERDTNGDGSLSAEEMTAAAENAERAERRVAKMIERHDDNGNGSLELGEIGPSEERMAERFERLDADGSGGISEEEFAEMRGKRGGGRDRG